MAAPRSRRLQSLGIVFITMLVWTIAVAIDASHRQVDVEAARRATTNNGMPDLALSSSSRWLRAPTQSERTAPLADAPISFDSDPAGALIGPVE